MILIKNGILVDGTGAKPQRKDVLVKDSRVLAIGNFPNKDSDLVIDAEGHFVAPGFIDINTDSDHYLSLFTDPLQQDFLLQGVTTIIGGHCGSSLAPLLYGSLESVRKWGDTNQINIDWNTFGEFLAVIRKIQLGVNFGTLVGHSTVRRAILGEQLRDLTERELEVLKKIIKEALEDGAFGVSTGLGYNHSRNTPYLELKAIADLAAQVKGVYATHLRSETEEVVKSVEETLQLAADAKVKVLISHFRPIVGFEEKYDQAKELIENFAGGEAYFDLYPFLYSILPIYMLIPEVHRQGSLEKMHAELSVKHTVEEIKKALGKISGKGLTIARAPGFDFLVGKNIYDFAKQREMSAADALLELMRITRLKAVLFNQNVSEAQAAVSLLSEKAFVASNSPSLVSDKNVLENERAKKTFSKFIKLAQEKKKSIEWIINKLTKKPADLFGLKERGVLVEGAIADIAVLKNNEAKYVLVAGEVCVSEGKTTGKRKGKVLTRT